MENDTTESYHSSSLRFNSASIPFLVIFSQEKLHPARKTESWRAKIVSNRERPDLTALLVNIYISEHCRKTIKKKILVPSEVHVDAARNKDNLSHFYKML